MHQVLLEGDRDSANSLNEALAQRATNTAFLVLADIAEVEDADSVLPQGSDDLGVPNGPDPR